VLDQQPVKYRPRADWFAGPFGPFCSKRCKLNLSTSASGLSRSISSPGRSNRQTSNQGWSRHGIRMRKANNRSRLARLHEQKKAAPKGRREIRVKGLHTFLDHELDQVGHSAAVAPLVVIPAHKLEKPLV